MAEYLASIFGTEKDKVNCSFYFKIGACRHGDKCSRIHNRPTFSQTVLLQNLYQNPKLDINRAEAMLTSISDAEEQSHFDEFFEEIFTELEDKYGEIEEMNVCDNIGEHMIGNVYVKFKREEDADKAVREVNNRWFNGMPVYAELSPVTDFREACCRQYEMGECTRGGFCNFMHLKPISYELRRELYNRNHPWRSRSPDGCKYFGGAIDLLFGGTTDVQQNATKFVCKKRKKRKKRRSNKRLLQPTSIPSASTNTANPVVNSVAMVTTNNISNINNSTNNAEENVEDQRMQSTSELIVDKTRFAEILEKFRRHRAARLPAAYQSKVSASRDIDDIVSSYSSLSASSVADFDEKNQDETSRSSSSSPPVSSSRLPSPFRDVFTSRRNKRHSDNGSVYTTPTNSTLSDIVHNCTVGNLKRNFLPNMDSPSRASGRYGAPGGGGEKSERRRSRSRSPERRGEGGRGGGGGGGGGGRGGGGGGGGGGDRNDRRRRY